MTMNQHALNVWLEISKQAYIHNLNFFRQLIGPDVELAAVVKSNAYGHGLEQIAAMASGADSFCVHALTEAQQLRQAGFSRDILILGPIPIEDLEQVIAGDFRMALFTRESAIRLAELAHAQQRTVRIHLKLETGTHRQGVDADGLDWFLDFLTQHPLVVAEGVYTHFANIEDTTDHDYAEVQLTNFKHAVERLRAAGINPSKCHAACSAATLVFPETHFNMVRLGISQYGLWSSKETYLSYRLEHPDASANLQPALSWKTRVSQLKQVPAGSYVGYGCTYQTTRSTRIAVLPVGYADGYDRRFSNQAHVLIGGNRAPVRGRICMNLTMVDVTDIPTVALGDEVVLLGRQGDQTVTAEHLANLAGTIHYEILTRINWDLPRLVVD